MTLSRQIVAVEMTLSGLLTFEPVRVSTDPAGCARFWNVRKGMFPSVGAMRRIGTTVIIEDVAFPVECLAEATLALQRLLARAETRRLLPELRRPHHGRPARG